MKSTQKILIVGLILMVLLNVCTLGFILFKSNQHGHGHRPGMRGENHGRGKFIGKRLNFTAEQEAALVKIREEHETKMSVLRARTDSLRKQRFELIKADPFDGAKADALATEIGNCQAAIEKQMTDHFVAIKALCTKEQLADFNQFIDRLGEHMPGSH